MASAGGFVEVVIKNRGRAAKKLARGKDRIVRKAQSRSLRAAAKPVLRDAKAFVDSETGTLEDSLKIRAGKRRRHSVSIVVQTGDGFFKGETFYGAFVEYGHRMGKRPKSGQADTRRIVMPHPYLQPAADKNRRRVPLIYAAKLRREMRGAFR